MVKIVIKDMKEFQTLIDLNQQERLNKLVQNENYRY